MPPLSALRAFAAYTETGSVTAAATALNVSHPAISQQIRSLESHLGRKLLDRSSRKMALTAEGQVLASALQDGFGRIAGVIETLVGADAARPLHLTATPSFAANWLMPRLPLFRTRHPDIDLAIDPSPQMADPSPGGLDLAIRYGTGPWPGLDSALLMSSPVVVVGAQSLVGDLVPQSAHELSHFPWMEELGTSEGTAWLAKRGAPKPRAGTISVPGNLMIDGARTGQGLAITTRVAVADDLRSGRLRVLFEDRLDAGYHLVTARIPPRAPLRAFLSWLREEAKKAETKM